MIKYGNKIAIKFKAAQEENSTVKIELQQALKQVYLLESQKNCMPKSLTTEAQKFEKVEQEVVNLKQEIVIVKAENKDLQERLKITLSELEVKQSDVYSFGVVFLEMLSGMGAFDPQRPSGQENLVEWAKPYLSNWSEVLSRVMDWRLEGHYPSKGAVRAARLILRCLRPVPRNRPSMKEVVEALEQIQAIKHDP
ncbi:Protein kinase domain-containing protein [Cinnamomum micranthum f. kanehirae]|uniref:Protein kinase domain-containing protein n=1 Tax=Cinnamomum micranthum f. kanehirae TaxID=337451 RepID=A0A443NJ19_9MAGN|nr:Protein kinase domain-containing protein [Cinnamomum micranthum f. kanehirae]